MTTCSFPRWLLLVVVGVAALLGSGCRSSENQGTKDRTLKWGADAEGGAPYVFPDPENPKQFIGFEVDFKDALAREMNRPIEFEQRQYDNLVKDVDQGRIDFAMNGLEVTPDRKAQVRFTRPYYYYRLQLVTRDDDDRFQGLKDLEGKPDVKVGTLENTAASRLLKKLKIPVEEYPGQTEPFKNLELKRLDAVLLDVPIALYFAQKDPNLKYAMKRPGLKFVGAPIEPGEYAIAVKRDNEALARELNEALDRLIASGEMKRIYEKWGLWNDDQKPLAPQGARLTVPGIKN